MKLKPTIDSQMCGYKIDCLTVLNKHKAKKFPTINFWKASEGPQKIIQCAESVWAHGRFLLYGMYFMRHIMSCVLYARQIMCGVIISCDYKGTLLICCSPSKCLFCLAQHRPMHRVLGPCTFVCSLPD